MERREADLVAMETQRATWLEWIYEAAQSLMDAAATGYVDALAVLSWHLLPRKDVAEGHCDSVD